METSLLGIKQLKVIPKNEIKGFYQVKDGGRNKTSLPYSGGKSNGKHDSFPSWGLKVLTTRLTPLIYRQPYEKSYWLGQVLADWADVPFHDVEHQ